MTPDIDAGIATLAQTAEKLEELIEWDQLARADPRLDLPPGFRFDPHLDEEFRSIYGLFCQLDLSLKALLNSAPPVGSAQQLSAWQKRLSRLEQKVRKMDITQRFIKG